MPTFSSITGDILNHLGLTGGPLPTSTVAPRIKDPTSDIPIQQFTDLGQVTNSEIWSSYNLSMVRPTTYTAMLQIWREMSAWDLIAAALVQVVDEAIQRDDTKPGSIWYECDDSKVEDELNDMLLSLGVEEILPSQFWFLSALGNSFEKLEYSRGDGVTGLSFVDPMDVRRYWLQKNRQCIGFRWDKSKPPDRENFWLLNASEKIERVEMGTGNQSTEKLWYPWDFLHFRRMYRYRESEHGEPIFDEAQGIYRKMRIALDQMVVHRAQVQPDRYVVNIDVGEQPPVEQMKTVQRWKQSFRTKLAFGLGKTGSGMSDPTDFSSFYNALGLDSIFYVARPKGFNHAIEKLAGTPSVPDIYDVELLTNLFFSVLGMPKEWLGIKSGEGDKTVSGKALLAQDIRFLRKIKALRRPIITGYQWLGNFHAILKGHDVNQTEIRVKMSEIGSLDEQIKLEMLKTQAEVLNELSDVMKNYNLPREAWVETIFKRYMHLPDDVVNTFITALPDPIQTESVIKGKFASTTKALMEVRNALRGNERATWLTQELERLSHGAAKKRTYRNLGESAARQAAAVQKFNIEKNDTVVSSFGPLSPEPISESQSQTQKSGYRRFDYRS
jgi:Bacteriophage T4-like portal protein (Gp20)